MQLPAAVIVTENPPARLVQLQEPSESPAGTVQLITLGALGHAGHWPPLLELEPLGELLETDDGWEALDGRELDPLDGLLSELDRLEPESVELLCIEDEPLLGLDDPADDPELPPTEELPPEDGFDGGLDGLDELTELPLDGRLLQPGGGLKKYGIPISGSGICG